MREWLEARYSPEALWAAWGAVLLGYAGFLVLERLIPARRNPGVPEFAADVRANLVFVLLNPVALFLGGWLSSLAAGYLGGPRFRVDLAVFGSGAVSAFLLTGVVTGPQYHRIDHSIESNHLGKNYAAFFPIWDWIFGTYCRPAKGEWPETGLPDTNGVWGLGEMVFSPFAGWWRRLEGSLK